MRKLAYLLSVLAILTVGVLADPAISQFRNRSVGAVVSFVDNSGTNAFIEVVYEGDVPFRLFESVATTNRIATACTVDRIWYYESNVESDDVSTNLFGQVLTNTTVTLTRSAQTNRVYDSPSDTLPVAYYFNQNDILRASFGSVTNVLYRMLGTAQ